MRVRHISTRCDGKKFRQAKKRECWSPLNAVGAPVLPHPLLMNILALIILLVGIVLNADGQRRCKWIDVNLHYSKASEACL